MAEDLTMRTLTGEQMLWFVNQCQGLAGPLADAAVAVLDAIAAQDADRVMAALDDMSRWRDRAHEAEEVLDALKAAVDAEQSDGYGG